MPFAGPSLQPNATDEEYRDGTDQSIWSITLGFQSVSTIFRPGGTESEPASLSGLRNSNSLMPLQRVAAKVDDALWGWRRMAMPSRVWGILLAVGVLAFVLGSLLSGVSLVLGLIGWTRTQLAFAGVGEWLVSFVLLLSGFGFLSAAWRHVRRSDLPLLPRSGVILSQLACGCLMTLAGINGILWPELLRMAVGLK